MIEKSGYWVFETAIGLCSIIWRDASIIGFQLPEQDARTLDRSTRARFGAPATRTPPPWIRRIAVRVRRHLTGDTDDFRDLPLDLSAHPPFHQQVYTAVRAVTPGQTRSYGEIAAQLGRPGGARAVGQAMRRNPVPLFVPCHRVLAAGSKPGGFTAHGGLATKAAMLRLEGVSIVG
jgi:methylated-DNA-[protein]-cysteine S-methyltransferase